MVPLISHEIPKSMIAEHQDAVNDYMFVLLHKLMEDDDYAKLAYDYRDAGGVVYLDNSCYELGASLDNDILYDYCQRLRPDVVILPDVLGDKNATLDRTFEYLDKYPECSNYGMAVAQGSTDRELIECYAEFRDYRGEAELDIYMLGIPFVFKWAEKDPTIQAEERINLLHKMDYECALDKNRLHHLLGTWQPREFIEYQKYNWIYSIDTSNPVMAALEGTKYTNEGPLVKPKPVFDSTFHLSVDQIDMDMLYYNVEAFRSIVHGSR